MRKNSKLLLAATALVLPIAHAADPPELKEGLWSIRIQMTNIPGGKKEDSTSLLCRNHAYDRSAIDLAKNVQKNCSKYEQNFQGGKYTTDMHCTVAGSPLTPKERPRIRVIRLPTPRTTPVTVQRLAVLPRAR